MSYPNTEVPHCDGNIPRAPGPWVVEKFIDGKWVLAFGGGESQAEKMSFDEAMAVAANFAGSSVIMRMRNIDSEDIIMADIL